MEFEFVDINKIQANQQQSHESSFLHEEDPLKTATSEIPEPVIVFEIDSRSVGKSIFI